MPCVTAALLGYLFSVSLVVLQFFFVLHGVCKRSNIFFVEVIMFIKLIKQIIPSPNLNVSFDRNEINAKLGINLPDDYYDLVAIYGAGTFANFIKILVPFSNEFEYSLFQFMEIDREDYSYGRDFLELDVNNEDFDDPRLQKG